MILNIAHRGGAGLFPENTLAAFRNAVALGCEGAELDVQLSRDGEVVVFHDYCLKPELCRDVSGGWLTKPTPYLKELTLADLRQYDIGRAGPASDYMRKHASVQWRDGERIPSLVEVIEVAKAAPKPFRLLVELKTSFTDRNMSADPKALAEATLRVLRKHDYLARTTLVSFDWPGLLYAKQLEPEIECWFITLPQSWFGDAPPPAADEPPSEPALQQLRRWARTGTSPWAGGYDAVNYAGSILRSIKAAGGDGWYPMHRDVTRVFIDEARTFGLKVGAWTVNADADMRRLCALDVDAICTDRPDLLASVLG
ncbi:MAG TPA: glycerophosphodiester phosphodiesterase family protein [Rhizomicrobium sp.]|nr:glycerophosphodiester phosphodiesterase family protein [Rhizomicrobium sp.]